VESMEAPHVKKWGGISIKALNRHGILGGSKKTSLGKDRGGGMGGRKGGGGSLGKGGGGRWKKEEEWERQGEEGVKLGGG